MSHTRYATYIDVLIQINNSSRNTLPNSIPVDIADEIEFHSIEKRQFNAELILYNHNNSINKRILLLTRYNE